MKRLLLLAVVLVAWLGAAPSAWAQRVPFFNQGAALFDPEISVVNSGVLNDVQATVSADRKYVTLNMRSSNSELVALREFAFQTGNTPTGFAGGAGGGGGAGLRGNNNIRGGNAAGGDGAAGQQRPSILNREGMTLVGRADAPSAAPASRSRTGAP